MIVELLRCLNYFSYHHIYVIRHALESLFDRCISLYRSGDQNLVNAINEADKSGEFKKIVKSGYPKMSTMNKILLNEALWSIIAVNLGLPVTLKFPNLESSSLIYGVLSDSIHNPDLDRVILSNKSDETFKVFFKALAVMLKKSYFEFDEELSIAADETESKFKMS